MAEQNKCSIDNGENCTPPLIGERRREAITAPSGLRSLPQINSVDFPGECNTSGMTSLVGKNSTNQYNVHIKNTIDESKEDQTPLEPIHMFFYCE